MHLHYLTSLYLFALIISETVTFVVGKQFCLFGWSLLLVGVWSLLFCLCLLWLLATCLTPTMTGFLCSQRCFNLLLMDRLLFII